MGELVSVVMPVYNGAAFIAEAVESVIAQVYPDWELIVVDDGSTDSTAHIVAGFEDTRIRYTYQENRGQAAALNHGLDLARGDYVTTLDADDCFTPNSLSDRVAYLNDHPEFGAVYGDGYYCNAAGEPLLRFCERCACNVVGDIYEALIVGSIFGTGAAVMMRRDILDRYQLRYDEEIIWCQDWDLYVRAAERTTFGYIECITVRYRLHDSNMTRVVPSARRQASSIRARLKVMTSPRFTTVSVVQKSKFFYNLLLRTLQGRVEDQSAVMSGAQFRALPGREQSRLLRLVAIEYLLKREHGQVTRKWLQSAWSVAPLDIKTGLVAGLSTVSLDFARLAAKAWRSGQPKDDAVSPFEVAKDVVG